MVSSSEKRRKARRYHDPGVNLLRSLTRKDGRGSTYMGTTYSTSYTFYKSRSEPRVFYRETTFDNYSTVLRH